MKKFSKIGKRVFALFLVALMNINTYATTTSNDGSSFITKAEFDTMMKKFNENMNQYQAGLNAKIDAAIAKYIGGLSGVSVIDISLPGYLWMKSYGSDVTSVELGIDTRKNDAVKDDNGMYRQGKLYTYYPKYYFSGSATACVGFSEKAIYTRELYCNHIIYGKCEREQNGNLSTTTNTGRNYATNVKDDNLISINPSIYLVDNGKSYVNKVVKAPKVVDNETSMVTSRDIGGNWTYGGFLYYFGTNVNSNYNLFGLNKNGVVTLKGASISGFGYELMEVRCSGDGSPGSGYSNLGAVIYGRGDSGKFGWLNGNRNFVYPNMKSYVRIVDYTNEENHIVPRFLKLPNDDATVDSNKIIAVDDLKGDNYETLQNQLTSVSVRSVGVDKVWYPIGNISNTDSSYVPLNGGVSYKVKTYELNGRRFQATELYDYFVKNNYNTDVTLADRVIVYRNEELDSVKLQFKIIPTSNFLLTFSKNKEYEDGETNLYTFTYNGGSEPISGRAKSLAIDSSIFNDNNPLNIEIDGIKINDFVWLGGQSINDGYVTFKFLENAKVLK